MNTARTSKYQFEYRIAILGGCQVGKTSILNQLIYERFSYEYTPTIETDMQFVTEFEGNTYVCILVDTDGGNDFPAMRKLCISKANGFLVVFSLSDEYSYVQARHQIREIMTTKNDIDSFNIVLVGNKRDLGRCVKTDDVKEYSRSINNDNNIQCRYIEVSAIDTDDVRNMFNLLLDMFPIKPDSQKLKHLRKLSITTDPRQRLVDRNNFTADPRQRLVDGNNYTADSRQRLVDGNNYNSINCRRSPSLFSLNNFSTDDDINNRNYNDGELVPISNTIFKLKKSNVYNSI